MTANDKLLIFHGITLKLRGRARRYAGGCHHREDDILAAAADIFVGRLRDIGSEGQMVRLGQICLAEAARKERRAEGGNRRVDADWDAWEGSEATGRGVGLRRWQQSPLADPRQAEQQELTRRDVLERQIELIAGMPLSDLAASCAAMGRMQRKRLIDALRRKLGIVPTRRLGGVCGSRQRRQDEQLDLFAATGR